MPQERPVVPCHACDSSFPPIVVSGRRKPPGRLRCLGWCLIVFLILHDQTHPFLPSFGDLVPSGKVLVLWKTRSSKIGMQWFPSHRKSRVWFSCTSLSVGGSTVSSLQ